MTFFYIKMTVRGQILLSRAEYYDFTLQLIESLLY